MDIPITTDRVLPAQVSGKTFWSRAAAYIIDAVAFFLINIIVGFVVGVALGIAFLMMGREVQFNPQSQTECLNYIVGAIQMVLYFTIFEWLYGASLGKLILGMRVVKENGEPCDLGAGLIRGVLRYIDGFFFAIPAYFKMKPPFYQRIGDMAAKTIVVDSKDKIIQRQKNWLWFVAAGGFYTVVAAIGLLILTLARIR